MSDDKLDDIFPAPSGPSPQQAQEAGLGKGLPDLNPVPDPAQLDLLKHTMGVQGPATMLNEEVSFQPHLEASSPINAFIDSTALQANSTIGGPSLCDKCIHCWSIRKQAEVMNLDVNGKPFMSKEAFCAVMPQSLFSLNDRTVLECNKFETGGRPRTTLEDIK